MTKTELLRKLRTHQKQRDAYLETIPQDLRSVVWENEYSENLQAENALLMLEAFGEQLNDWAGYFLYEWKPGFHVTDEHGKEFLLNSDEDYFEFFEGMYK